MSDILIRRSSSEDAKLLTDLSYTTFWDAFAHHPKNAPDDLDHYMRQAFNQDQIEAELADESSIFGNALYSVAVDGMAEPHESAALRSLM